MTRLHLSVDLEDRDQICAARYLGRTDIVSAGLEADVARLLDLLDAHGARATFFVLGMLARARPRLVAEVARRGHEIGLHGDQHARIDRLGEAGFRRDLAAGRAAVEDAVGASVDAFRAPEFSLTRREGWAFDVLAAEGFRLDSSLIPLAHPRYGDPGAPREVHELRPGLWEVPVSVADVGGRAVPFAGGGFFRLWPLAVTRHLARRAVQPPVYYFHPYDFAARPFVTRLPGLTWRQRLELALADLKQSLGNRVSAARLAAILRAAEALPLSAALPAPAPAR